MKMTKKYLRMSRMFVLLIFFAALLGRTCEVLILYASVLLHECAHLSLCRKLRIPTEYMIIAPYGMELRLGRLTSPSEQIKISAAGPFANLILLLGGCLLMRMTNTRLIRFFTQSNFVLLVFNLIPCMPLDGSEILRSVISAKFGIINSYRIIKKISAAFAVLIFLCGALYFYAKANPSLLVIAFLAAQNILLSDRAVIRAAKEILTENIPSRTDRIVMLHLNGGKTIGTAVRYISFCYTLCIRLDNCGAQNILKQGDIIRLAKANPSMTLYELTDYNSAKMTF